MTDRRTPHFWSRQVRGGLSGRQRERVLRELSRFAPARQWLYEAICEEDHHRRHATCMADDPQIALVARRFRATLDAVLQAGDTHAPSRHLHCTIARIIALLNPP